MALGQDRRLRPIINTLIARSDSVADCLQTGVNLPNSYSDSRVQFDELAGRRKTARGPIRQCQIVRPLTAESPDVQAIRNRDHCEAAFPMCGRESDIVSASVHRPAVTMIVTKKTRHHVTVIREQAADFPAVIDI